MGVSRFARALLLVVLAASTATCRASRTIPSLGEPGAEVTIGVVLPLSGKLRAFGAGGQDAVRLAMGELDRTTERGIRVRVRDSKGDASGAATAVEELVEVDGAIAIVGPLFRAEATAAAEKAQDLGVPIIALTGDRQVTSAGSYAFRAGCSPEDEVDALVEYAMGELRLERFAVLHPRVRYGERMFELFKERVEARGGSLRGVETYAEEDTTFTEPIRRLVALDAPGQRADYRQAAAKCKSAPDSYRKARCEREAKERLAPIIDFQALFIPDSHPRVALIAPALTAADIIVERDPQALERIEKALGHKVRPVTLLGTSAWNSPELVKKAGRSVENAVFPDAYYAEGTDSATRGFVAAFKKHFKRRPELQDALLFDATRWVREVLTRHHPATTRELRGALLDVEGFLGVTGQLSFRDGTEVHRTLKILTVKNQALRPAKQAPSSLGAGRG